MIPINLDSWIEENKEKLKPPVGNYLIQRGKDFIVMLVGISNQFNHNKL